MLKSTGGQTLILNSKNHNPWQPVMH